jgi:hypothetical protein
MLDNFVYLPRKYELAQMKTIISLTRITFEVQRKKQDVWNARIRKSLTFTNIYGFEIFSAASSAASCELEPGPIPDLVTA